MSKPQSPSKPDIGRIRNDALAILQAQLRGDQSVCARIRKFSPGLTHASDAEILAAGSAAASLEIASREHGF